MLSEFSKSLLVLSALAGVLYFVMSYPMVFEKMRKYLPFKFNNTKRMLIFNSVVFALVMYFMSFIVLKSLHLEGFIPEQTPTPSPSYPRITGLWTGPGRIDPVYIYIYKPDDDIKYTGKIVQGDTIWKTVDITCGEDITGGGRDHLCANKMSFKINANYDNGHTVRGTIMDNTIRWEDNTVWTKYIGDSWVDPLPYTWGYAQDSDGKIVCLHDSNDESENYFRNERDCKKTLRAHNAD